MMITYFAGMPELRTSYANQRAIAARELGDTTRCGHGHTLIAGCFACRRAGCVLLPPAQNDK